MGNEPAKAAKPDAAGPESGNVQRMNSRLKQRLEHGVNFNSASRVVSCGPAVLLTRASRAGRAVKIVIRGERGTGKSALLARLKGDPFATEYTPTPEITTATISWRSKTTDDVVKVRARRLAGVPSPLPSNVACRPQVEVWDVVDVALPKKEARKEANEDDFAGTSVTARARALITAAAQAWPPRRRAGSKPRSDAAACLWVRGLPSLAPCHER